MRIKGPCSAAVEHKSFHDAGCLTLYSLEQVLARNATSLQAVFRVYARPSGHET